MRVLEDKKIERVGDHTPISVDVRIITATHKNLERLIEQNLFREDLFFRINVFPLYCPTLIERKEDIPIISQNFIKQNAKKSGKKILGLTPDAMGRLMSYSWPGNIRELRNAIEYAFVLCPSGAIDVSHLPPKISHPSGHTSQVKIVGKKDDFSQKEELIQVLKQADGNQSEAARILEVSQVTIWKRMKKYDIKSDFK